jgi:acyl-CoA dehydrogenase
VLTAYIAELEATAAEVRRSNTPEFGRMGERLEGAIQALKSASRWMGDALKTNPDAALAGATPYLRLFGLAAGGTYLARSALHLARNGKASAPAVASARFFAENLAVAAPGLSQTIMESADGVLGISSDMLSVG